MRFTTFFILLTFLPLLIFSQEVTKSPREDTTNIKNFNVSVDFLNTFNINLETNEMSDTISGFLSTAHFHVDSSGKGYIEFELYGVQSTIAIIVSSEIYSYDDEVHLHFQCLHSERPERIQMTLQLENSLPLEREDIRRFVVLNEFAKKAFVFC
jgi:hypothetical protein